MKTSDLREKDINELEELILTELKTLFGLKIQKSSEELKKTSLLKDSRRQIARIKTVISEKKDA